MKYDFGFIAIGDEITDGDIINSNSSELAKYLINNEFNIGMHISCKDCFEDISSSIKFLLENHTNIVTTGGLGPTEDDLTSKVIAKYFNRELLLDDKSWDKLEKRLMEKYGKITFGAQKQCMFPNDSEILENDNGTANGFKLEFISDRYIYVLPGPPKECIPMLKSINFVDKPKSKKIIRKKWQAYNIGESLLAEKLETVKTKYPFVSFKYRAASDFVELKYFYPEYCQYSEDIIKDVEKTLKDFLSL